MPPPDVVGAVFLLVIGGVLSGVVMLAWWAWQSWRGWR